MIIVGIDPGLSTTGYGAIEKIGSKHRLITYGAIRTPAKLELQKRLVIISDALISIFTDYQPQYISVEELFFNNNAKTALIVGQARGVILLTAERLGIPTFSYTPLQVKMSVCGYGLAHKQQIQYMVQRLLNMESIPRPDDAADALALAICHSHSHRLKSLI